MNDKPDTTTAARMPTAKLLVPALLACLALAGCAREDAELAAESETSDAVNPPPAQTAPAEEPNEALADQNLSDPCVGLTGTALDDCRAQQDATGTMGDAGALEDPMDELGDDQLNDADPLEEGDMTPPPVDEEPMDNEATEDPNEVPQPA